MTRFPFIVYYFFRHVAAPSMSFFRLSFLTYCYEIYYLFLVSLNVYMSLNTAYPANIISAKFISSI